MTYVRAQNCLIRPLSQVPSQIASITVQICQMKLHLEKVKHIFMAADMKLKIWQGIL